MMVRLSGSRGCWFPRGRERDGRGGEGRQEGERKVTRRGRAKEGRGAELVKPEVLEMGRWCEGAVWRDGQVAVATRRLREFVSVVVVAAGPVAVAEERV